MWFKLICDISIIFWLLGIIPYLWEIIASYHVSIFERTAMLLLLLIVRIAQFGKFSVDN